MSDWFKQKRKNAKGQTRYTYTVRDRSPGSDGSSESKTFTSDREGRLWAQRKLVEWETGERSPTLKNDRLLKDALKEFVDEVVVHQKGFKQKANRLIGEGKSWSTMLPKTKLSKLTPILIRETIEQNVKLCSRGYGRTRNQYLYDLSSALTWMSKDDRQWIKKNHCRDVTAWENAPKLQTTVSDDAWDKYLTAAYDMAKEQPDRLVAIQFPIYIQLQDAAATRRNEIVNLKIADVDFETGRARINVKSKNKDKFRITLLPVELLAELMHVQQGRRTEQHEYLFIGRYTDRPTSFDHYRLTVLDRAGLEGVRAKDGSLNKNGIGDHTLRRSAATRAGKAGASVAELQAMGGWLTPKIAMDYVVTDTDMVQAGQALAQRSKKPGKPGDKVVPFKR